MACAALKRPHNFDLLGGSPDHKASASPKRRRCGVVASTCSSTSVSPFLEATPKLSKGIIQNKLYEQIDLLDVFLVVCLPLIIVKFTGLC